MKIIADTNVLVRFMVRDDEAQFDAVCRLFKRCEEIAIPTHVICELFWVLSAAYKLKNNEILEKIALLAKSRKINLREDEVEAGLSMVRGGGDFSDGVNAYSGRLMASGSAVFASFDRSVVRLLAEQGVATLIPE